jgi:serine/threonine protein kinase
MEYAVLMPWIQGSTWFDILRNETNINQDASKKLAKNTANVLAGLEERGFAHCDVAGANVIVNTITGMVSLIDVEDMFGPSLSLQGNFPQGTAGYQHRTSRNGEQGQWCVEGDRFSGAVLLAEMLAWHNPAVRQVFNAETDEQYFAEGEMQDQNSSRYRLVLNTLAEISSEIADCFAQAWESAMLADCPPLREWAKLLEFPLVSDWLPIKPPPPQSPYQPKSWTPIPAVQATGFNPTFVPLPLPFETQPGRVPSEAPGFCWIMGANSPAATLNWTPVQGAQGYRVEAADDESFTGAVQLYQGTDTSFMIAAHTDNLKYYRVCAYNANGVGAWSKAVKS